MLLTEALGRADVVPRTAFDETLAQGRSVMVSLPIVARDGFAYHQVVLSKAFQHGGETWYVVRDSNQGPRDRRFMSARDLAMVVRDNGVVCSAPRGATPRLLRQPTDP